MIINFSDLSKIRAKYSDKTIAFTGGVFDILHVGHIEYLEFLKSLADITVVAVSSDARVRERKGQLRPIISEQDRVTMIDNIQFVDYSLIAPDSSVFLTDQPVPSIQIMQELKPDFFITQDNRWFKYEDKIKQCGTKLVFDKTKKRFSTTQIVNKILEAYTQTV